METTELIIAALGLAWASGLNLYAGLATLGILAATGQMTLPPGSGDPGSSRRDRRIGFHVFG